MAPYDSPVTCLKFEQWPLLDRELWTASCTLGYLFDDPGYGSGLRFDTLQKVRKGYGRWLCFLVSYGWLDEALSPLARVTRVRLRRYFQELRQRGNADATVVGRFSELQFAMKIMTSDADVSWISRPYGARVAACLPGNKRVRFVPSSVVLYDWGGKMMDRADLKPTLRERLCAYRDGLLIMMLASRARRLRSMSLLTFGKEIFEEGGRYYIDLARDQVKTNRRDRFPLSSGLSGKIRYYLANVRPKLLAGKSTEAFWVNALGDAWSAKSIQHQICELSKKQFGIAFGPHRFRHAAATTASLLDPSYRGLAASLLCISAGVVEENYDKAGQVEAAARYASLLNARAAALNNDVIE